MLLRFPEFAPDAATFEGGATAHMNNVLAGSNYYGPIKSLEAYSSNGLDSSCLGALSARQTDRTMRIFAGDQNKLYELSSTDLGLDDVSKAGSPAYNVLSGDYWWLLQWRNKIVAGAASVTPQSFDMASSTIFADMGGSPPVAVHAGIIGPHLMLGNLAATPNGAQWCAALDEDVWTTGGGPGKGGEQEFATGGHVRDVTSGRVAGFVFQESAIRRAYFVGGNQQFQFDVIINDIGLDAPRSRVTVGGIHYFLSAHGFYAFNGETLNPIGRGRVDNFFFDQVSGGDVYSTWGSIDQGDTKIYWVYSDGSNNFYICYDYRWDKWTPGDMNANVVFPFNPVGIDLDSIDAKFPTYNLDTLPWPLDSRFFQGGSPTFGAFDRTTFKLSTFTGSSLEATIDTMEGQLVPGRRALVSRVRPQVDGADDATVAMGTRERLGDAVTYSTAFAQRNSGGCPVRSTSRYHRARVNIPAGSTWTKAIGVDVPGEHVKALGDR